MKKHARIFSIGMAMALAVTGLAACSGPASDQGSTTTNAATMADGTRDPAQKAAVSTPAAAPVKNVGDMKVVSTQPDKQYLYDLMQQSAFSDAFAAMDGVKTLPAWVSAGGTATPVHTVTVNGQSRLLAEACKPHDCPGERVMLLYDKAGHAMQGVFVHDPSPGVDASISEQAQLTWLGKPDADVKAWLKQALTSR